jgi:hypothetical protein
MESRREPLARAAALIVALVALVLLLALAAQGGGIDGLVPALLLLPSLPCFAFLAAASFGGRVSLARALPAARSPPTLA